MKRLFFRDEKRVAAARILFGEEEDFHPQAYEKYTELEVVVQDDGRYSVWGNFPDDADLLQDTRRDSQNKTAELEPLADTCAEED
ncbi:hypothetical protein [Anaeromassilibacillus senegalensis]|uniref:hypothetical protein n=1 Tax=Anaeromassilibacillus senegalensis TaxID=1673717 RepID=UPI00067FD6A4|nr:hypothetical protein [Anaeromassilibacillus senegalensis]